MPVAREHDVERAGDGGDRTGCGERRIAKRRAAHHFGQDYDEPLLRSNLLGHTYRCDFDLVDFIDENALQADAASL